MYNIGLISAIFYTALAVAAAGTFLAVTSFTGDYSAVSRFGGAGWVFMLSMIVLMPTVTSLVKKVLREA